MIDALYIAESGLDAKQKQLDAIAHNIANLSTPGYKASQINFMTVVQEQRNEQGELVQAQGAGIKVMPSSPDMGMGKIEHTGRVLDIAINGAGLLEVNDANGNQAYSRGGSLVVDAQGYLSTNSGHRLASMIQVSPDVSDLNIAKDGTITAVLDNQQSTELGQLQLIKFTDDSALKSVGENLYHANQESLDSAYYGSPGEAGMGHIQQGMLESSNVSMNQEMMNMMMAQRSYQLNARLVQVSDQILETLNNLRR